MRSRTTMFAAGPKPGPQAAARERAGKRVSPKAAIAPLIPRIITVPRLTVAIHTARLPARTGALPAVHHAVSVRQASRVSVFTRCADSEYARADDWFLATCSNRTSDAPRSEERRVGKECRSRWSP